MSPFSVFFLICACFEVGPVHGGLVASKAGAGTGGSKARSFFHNFHIGHPGLWNSWSLFPNRPRGDSDDIANSQTSANNLGAASNGHLGVGFTIDYNKRTEAGLSQASTDTASTESGGNSGDPGDFIVPPDTGTDVGLEAPSITKSTTTETPSSSSETLNDSPGDPSRTPIIILDAATLLALNREAIHQFQAQNYPQTPIGYNSINHQSLSERIDQNVDTAPMSSAPINLSEGSISESRVNFSSGNLVFQVETKNFTANQVSGQKKESTVNSGSSTLIPEGTESFEVISAEPSNLVQSTDYSTSVNITRRDSVESSSDSDGSSTPVTTTVSETGHQAVGGSRLNLTEQNQQGQNLPGFSSATEGKKSFNATSETPQIEDITTQTAKIEEIGVTTLSSNISMAEKKEPLRPSPPRKDTVESSSLEAVTTKTQAFSTPGKLSSLPGPPPLIRAHYYPVYGNFWYPHNGPHHSYTTEYVPPQPQVYQSPVYQPPVYQSPVYQPPVFFTNDYAATTDYERPTEVYGKPQKPIFTPAVADLGEASFYNYKPVTSPVYLTKGTTPYRGVTIYLESDTEATTTPVSTVFSANQVTTEKPSINSWFRPPQFLTNIISVLHKDNVGKPRDKPQPTPKPSN